ncbi:SDR family oxidoreductase [Mycoplasmatota bacterium zrk1]
MKFRYGKVALVVGASSGVGKECANYLLESGYKVYGTSRKATFDNSSNMLSMIPLDVTDESTIKEAVDYILEKEGGIGVLINCPGYGLAGAIEDTSIEEAKRVFDTNFFGIMNVCNFVLPHMRRQRKGLIINISSVAGFISLPFQSMYSASKYALESLTESYRMEVSNSGVKFSLIEPGDMKTNFLREYVVKSENSDYKERCDQAVNKMIKDEQNGPEPRVVIKELKHILKKKNPPIRRIVGLDYKMIGILKKLLPAKFVEFVIIKMYGGN